MEMLFIFLLALLLLGPKELPPLARLISRTLNELNTLLQKLEREWNLKQKGSGK